MRFHVFSPAVTQGLVVTVFDKCQLTRVEHHAHVRVREIEFLVSAPSPHYFTYFLSFQISNYKRLNGVGNHKSIL